MQKFAGARKCEARASPPMSGRRGRRDLTIAEPRIHRVARVAVAALPVGIRLLSEILEDVARAASRGLAVVDHRAQLRLVALPTLLVIGEIRTQIHLREPLGQPLPAAAAIL